MSEAIVLDASSMLAAIQNEPGAEYVDQAIERSEIIFVSSVNLCEVATKLASYGRISAQILIGLQPFLGYAVDFDVDQAMLAAELTRQTKPLGLSLGDRACLALAASRKATAWTTDQAWQRLQLGLSIRLLR